MAEHRAPAGAAVRLPARCQMGDHGATVHVIQARPMTALPDPVAWTPPDPGCGPATSPRRVAARARHPAVRRLAAARLRRRVPCRHGGHRPRRRQLPDGSSTPLVLRHPESEDHRDPGGRAALARRLLPFMLTTVVQPGRKPAAADPRAGPAVPPLAGPAAARLPPTRRPSRRRSPNQGTAVTDRAGDHHGRLPLLVPRRGRRRRLEDRTRLRRFMDHHRLDSADAARLLSGLTPTRTAPAPHAVHSLDWYQPTAGEHTPASPPIPPDSSRPSKTQLTRRRVEQRCADQLRDRPRQLRRGRRCSPWRRSTPGSGRNRPTTSPLSGAAAGLRPAARRVPDCSRRPRRPQPNLLPRAHRARSVHLPHRDRAAPTTAVADTAAAHPTPHHRDPAADHRTPPRRHRRRPHRHRDDDQIHGQPASPGRASGPARIVRELDDFTKVQSRRRDRHRRHHPRLDTPVQPGRRHRHRPVPPPPTPPSSPANTGSPPSSPPATPPVASPTAATSPSTAAEVRHDRQAITTRQNPSCAEPTADTPAQPAVHSRSSNQAESAQANRLPGIGGPGGCSRQPELPHTSCFVS